ncbi:MAG TPA: PQQ-binding-like beta-propeller repeat protein [Tepidisphaeraceae bacterium]|jgi:outer membrane protein assembly factor BamB
MFRCRVLGLSLLFVSIAFCQPAPPPETGPQVFVHDSTDVLNKIALAERMAHLRQWDTAATTLQEIIDKNADRVIPTQADAQNHPTQYATAAWLAQLRLSQWPTEGLQVYRAKYDALAAALLAKSQNDPAILHTIVERYFLTPSAEVAGERLADDAITAGNFAEAAWLGQKFLSHESQLGSERARWLFTTAIANHLTGDDANAKNQLTELRDKFPQSLGKVAGKDVVLADALDQWLRVAPPADQRTGNSWSTLWGDDTRNRLITSTVKVGASPLLSIPLSVPGDTPGIGDSESDIHTRQQEDRALGMWLNVWPIVDGDCLYFQDATRICARNLDTGLAPQGWTDYATGPAGSPIGTALAITLTSDSLLAITGQGRTNQPMSVRGIPPFYPGTGPVSAPPARLVSLDRTTGQLRWSAGSSDLPDQGSLRSLTFSGCPLVAEGNVYVLARGSRAGQFDDCYLLCFQEQTGKYMWSSYIASASATMAPGFGNGGGPSNDLSHLSYLGGRIFVQSNVGAVAALDAQSGNILWLDVYSRREITPVMRRRFFGGAMFPQAKPWTFNAPLIDHGRVFVLPCDGDDLLVYDASDGKEIQHLSLSDFDQPETLLAADGDRVLFSSDDKLWCINWRAYDSAKFANGDQDCILWRQDFRESPIQGRPQVTQNVVYVPTRRLYRIDIRTGKIADVFPPLSQPLPAQGPGNILAIADKLIFACSDRIDVYGDPAAAIAELQTQEQAHPQDPEPMLRHAALLFAAGNTADAIAKLDQLQSLPAAIQPDFRQRIFDLTMKWIAQLDSQATQADQVTQLFTRDGAQADTPSQKADYCMARAKFAKEHQNWPTLIAMEQQILSSAATRQVTVTLDDGATQSAGESAQAAIADVISHGNERFYAPYEEESQKALDAARQSSKPADLLEVAERYPNSHIVSNALKEAAVAFGTKGNSAESTAVYHELIIRSPDAATQKEIFQPLAAQLLASDDYVAAISWLERASGQMLHTPLKLANGQWMQDISCQQAAKQLQDIQQKREDDARPTFNWDSPNPFAHEAPAINNVDALLIPSEPEASERIIAWSKQDGLHLYAADSGESIAANAEISDRPVDAQRARENLLVADASHLTLVRGADAKTIWRVGMQGLPGITGVAAAYVTQKILPASVAVEGEYGMPLAPNMMLVQGGVLRFGPASWPDNRAPDAASALQPEIYKVFVAGEHGIAAATDGRMFAVNLADGTLAWQVRVCDGPVLQLQANDFYAVGIAGGIGKSEIFVVDLFNGRVVRRIVPAGGAQITGLAISPDDRLLFSMGGQISRIDLVQQDAGDLTAGAVTNAFVQMQPTTGTDQFMIVRDRILSVCENGVFVSNVSMKDGVTSRQTLATGASFGQPVKIFAAWPKLYAVGMGSITGADLEAETSQPWTVPANVHLEDMLIGTNKLFVRGAGGRLLVYSRERTPHGESGLLQFDNPNHLVHIEAWQNVSGGFCYLANHRLHIVKADGG